MAAGARKGAAWTEMFMVPAERCDHRKGGPAFRGLSLRAEWTTLSDHQRRRFGIARVSAAALILAALAFASGGSAGTETSAVGPLVQVTPNELRLSQPLQAIDARGGRVAFAFCNQLVGVWRAGSTQVTRLGPVAQWTCPPPRSAEIIFSLALAGDRVAWSVHTGGNVVTNLLFMVVLGQPHTLTIPAEFSQCCRGFPEPDRIGDVYGDGSFIAFSSHVRCNDRDAPACPSGAPRTLLTHTVWRLRRPPLQAPCVNKPGPCVQLATRNDVLQPLSVDAGRVVLRRSNGILVVRKPGGGLVRIFPALAGRTRGAELMGDRLVVLVPGRILDFSLSTGARLNRRSVPNVPSAGVCGIPPCPQAALTLVDASRGLVAYVHAGDLHLLRLRDGQDVVVGAATDARFGDTGLFYAFSGAAPWPARIRFVPWASLPLQP